MTLSCPGGDTKQATEHTGLELRRQLWAEVKTRQGTEGMEMGGIAWEERVKRGKEILG